MRLLFEGLIIEESRARRPIRRPRRACCERRRSKPASRRFADPEEFLARVSFAAGHSPLPPLDEESVRAAVASLCRGRRSFAELERAAAGGGLERALLELLPPGAARLLAEVAPERIRLAGGRQVRVRYARNQTPWVASRLQDFFGMKDTPRVARGDGAAGGAPARAQPETGANHHRPGGLLGAALPASPPRAQPPLPPPRLARAPGMKPEASNLPAADPRRRVATLQA